jgi:hypothetical protein
MFAGFAASGPKASLFYATYDYPEARRAYLTTGIGGVLNSWVTKDEIKTLRKTESEWL